MAHTRDPWKFDNDQLYTHPARKIDAIYIHTAHSPKKKGTTMIIRRLLWKTPRAQPPIKPHRIRQTSLLLPNKTAATTKLVPDVIAHGALALARNRFPIWVTARGGVARRASGANKSEIARRARLLHTEYYRVVLLARKAGGERSPIGFQRLRYIYIIRYIRAIWQVWIFHS